MGTPQRVADLATSSPLLTAIGWLLLLLAAPFTVKSAEQPGALPQVTIQAQREAIQKQAQTFVRKVTGSAWASDEGEHMLGLWRIPVCPLIAGLPRAQGGFLFDRLTEVASAAGAHPGKPGCHPNLIVLVTTRPQELLSAWRKRDPRLFGRSPPAMVKRFFDKPLAVRFWYSTMLAGEHGDQAEAGSATALAGGAFGASGGMGTSNGQLADLLADIPTFSGSTGSRIGSRLGLGAVHDLATVIVVVDFGRMEGMSWGQLADYIAMAALTNVDSYSDFTRMPSILALFSSSPAARPAGLTDWDRAYLKALYHTDRMSPLQRLLIAEQMARELDPARPGASPAP